MQSQTVNISFQKDLLQEIDAISKEESRSRSELIREAARMYIQRKERWKKIFAYGEEVREKSGISEEEIVNIIRNTRKNTL